MSLIKILNKQRYKQNQPNKTSTVFSFKHGSRITPDTALEVSAFFRGVTYISTQLAKLPWDVKKLDNTLMNANSDVWFLLNRNPNDEMSAFNFKVLMVQLCIMRGNAFAEIVRDNTGKIRALVPILAHDINILRDATGTMFYQMSNTKTGDIVYLRKDEVLHFRNIHTEDGINGMSLINYASSSLGISAGADKMAGSLFANGGMPSGALETESSIGQETIERLKEGWRTKFGGNKAGGIVVLEEGMKFNPINFAPAVMQFLETRQFSVIEIARFLGVPPAKLYVIESQTYNNIEHANLEVSNDTLDPWARNLESEVDMKLLKSRQLKTEMDLSAVNRGDMKTRTDYFKGQVSIGAMTPNEVRRKEGDAPFDGGDEHYIATNNLTPIGRHDEIIDSQIKSKETPEEDTKLKEAIANKINKRR